VGVAEGGENLCGDGGGEEQGKASEAALATSSKSGRGGDLAAVEASDGGRTADRRRKISSGR
jgi:hypothetical protein